MDGINDIKNIIAKINLDGDDKITKEELAKAEGKLPSVWLNKLLNMTNGGDISTENIIKGLSIESNPENKPVTAFHDERPPLDDNMDFFDDIQVVPTKEEYLENYTRKGLYDVTLSIAEPLNPDLDFSDAEWFLNECAFSENTFANTPKEHLPEGYDPETVIENGKNPGLNTRAVHEMGITGKGVKVAIMDWALPPSDNYDPNIVSYKVQDRAKKSSDRMHGAAVTSILAGKETGVAPDVEVYYFAEEQAFRKEHSNEDMIKSFKDFLEINKNLPENEKIRVISISGPIYGGEEAQKLVKELNDSGVWVMSSEEFWKNFGYLGKKDPMGNPDDFDNYKIHLSASDGAQLYVNSGGRTVSHYTSEAEYRHDSKASASWAIPVVSGYYALACEADSSMTPEKFMKLAEETAQIKELTVPQAADPQRGYEIDQGYFACLVELIQKDRPELTPEECLKLDAKVLEEYDNKVIEEVEKSGKFGNFLYEKGKEVLAARGEYDENGRIKKLPEKYFPKEETVQAKIIDIKALIEKINSEKNK